MLHIETCLSLVFTARYLFRKRVSMVYKIKILNTNTTNYKGHDKHKNKIIA